jgi:hypothetical protein
MGRGKVSFIYLQLQALIFCKSQTITCVLYVSKYIYTILGKPKKLSAFEGL